MKGSEHRKEECPHGANNALFLGSSRHVLRLLWGCKTLPAAADGEGGFTARGPCPATLTANNNHRD